MKKHVFAFLALTVASSAMAQNTITEAKGVVTAIDPTTSVLQSLKAGDMVKTGSTLSTTQSVTVALEGGCKATLAAGQSMVVNATACEALLAQRSAAAGGGALASNNLALAVWGGGLLAVVANDRNRSISNN